MKKAFTFLTLAFFFVVSLSAQTNLATNGANASASDEIAGGEAALLFDGDTTTGWVVTSSPVQTIQYDFGSPVVVDGYSMHYLVDSMPDYQPVSWTFEGSLNGSDWVELDTVVDNSVFAEWEEFISYNTTAYQYYRLNITEAGADTLAMGELRLYVITVPEVITGEANYVNSELANCSGNVIKSGGSPVLQRGIVFNTYGNPTMVDSYHTSSAGLGSFNTLLINLEPATTYYFRAFATNALGTSLASDIKVFTTNKLDQTITFTEMPDKTYGDADFDPGASASSGLTVSYQSSNTDVATIVANQVHIIGGGTTTITALQTGNTTYNAAAAVEQVLNVGKQELQVTADDMEKVYGSANPFFTISYSGFINGDDAGDLDIEPTAACNAVDFSNAGSYFITPAGGSDNNYTFNYIPGYLTVTKAPLDLIISNTEREYGEENPEFSWIYSGFLNGDEVEDLDALPEGNTTATPDSDVGFYPITVVSGGDNNYEFVVTEGSLEIYKAPLTVSADNLAKTYGDANPELSCSYTGFKNDDSADDLDVVPILSTSADETSVVGEYPITITPFTDKNYELSYEDGSLKVEQAFLNATVENVVRYEGEANPEFVIVYSGFVIDDSAEDIDEAPVATCIADETSAAGNYAIEVSGGADDNYFILTYNGLLTVIEEPDAIDNLDDYSMQVYPNPASDYLLLEGDYQQALVSLTSTTGSLIMQQEIYGNKLDLNKVPAGMYLIMISENEEVIYQGKVFIRK